MYLTDDSASHGAVHPRGYSKAMIRCKIMLGVTTFPFKIYSDLHFLIFVIKIEFTPFISKI